MDIILIIGLPGSGKTYYCNQLDPKLFNVIDDITDLNQLPSQDDRTLVISSPLFCFPLTLESAKKQLSCLYPGCSLTYVYFERNIDKCKANIKLRDDDRKVLGLLDLASSVYSIPEGVEPLTIWQPS